MLGWDCVLELCIWTVGELFVVCEYSVFVLHHGATHEDCRLMDVPEGYQ